MLLIGKKTIVAMVAHCLDAYPLEACGLLVGLAQGGGSAEVTDCYPARNEAASARVYELEPRALLLADRAAEASGREVLGVYHSHTHTEAKPSPTDIENAPDPAWHYVIVSLRDTHPSVRSWRIDAGKTEEEQVVLEW